MLIRVLRFGALGLMTVLVATAPGAETHAASWLQARPTSVLESDGGRAPLVSSRGAYLGDSSWAPLVDSGSVWWLRGNYTAARSFTAYRRSLGGETLRRVALAGSSLTPPSGTTAGQGLPYSAVLQSGWGVRDGQVVIAGQWTSDPGSRDPTANGDGSAAEGLVAVFDGKTGALRRQQRPALADGGLPQPFVSGTPATTREAFADPEHPPPSVAWKLSDPVTQGPLAGSGEQVAGPFVLGFTTDQARWAAGDGLLRVADARTGVERYRLSASRVARVAGVPRKASISVRLQHDGSLRVAVYRRRGGLRPVSIDRHGAVRAVGPRLARAREIVTIVSARRAFVATLGQPEAKSPVRRCSGVWITDTTGRRGNQVTMPGRTTGRQGAPVYWDGTHALWSIGIQARDPEAEDRQVVRGETGLGRLRLSAKDRPSCSSVR